MQLTQKLVYATFVALLISTFVVSHPIRVDAADEAVSVAAPESVSSGEVTLNHRAPSDAAESSASRAVSAAPPPARALTTASAEQVH
ncbi:MAG: hypothetical protein ACR2Q3_05575 [Woeseiaceae bacterium]